MVLLVLVGEVFKPPKLENFGPGFCPQGPQMAAHKHMVPRMAAHSVGISNHWERRSITDLTISYTGQHSWFLWCLLYNHAFGICLLHTLSWLDGPWPWIAFFTCWNEKYVMYVTYILIIILTIVIGTFAIETDFNYCVLFVPKRSKKTSQELRMLSSVTINCQITKIVMNSGSQLSEL